MKPLLLASVAILALSDGARAEYVAQCSFGAKTIALAISDSESDNSATISVSDGTVVHGTSVPVGNGNGHLIRENNTATEWYVSPARKRGSYVRLQGKPRPLDCGGFAYTNLGATAPEPVHDDGPDMPGASGWVANNSPPVVSTPTYVPAAVYVPPPQAASNQIFVPLNSASSARSQAVNVTVGSTPVSMLIDSGCDTMAVSPALADQLIAQGEATVAGTITISLAGGQEHAGRKLIVRRVQVGDRVLTDVLANDGGADDSMLLGQSVLGHFGRFSIDRTAGQLVLG